MQVGITRSAYPAVGRLQYAGISNKTKQAAPEQVPGPLVLFLFADRVIFLNVY